jgi:uncharacterized protein
MNLLKALLGKSPLLARTAPFLVFLGLTYGQGLFPEAGRFWVYLLKVLVGAWLLWTMHSIVQEMRWAFSWEAVLAGVGVFGLWVGLDSFVPTQQELWIKLGLGNSSPVPSSPWNPFQQFGEGSALGWFFVIVRLLGSSLVVPPLEETFYRSFLYRWIVRPDFTSVPLGLFAWKPFLLSSLVFGFAHNEWLAGILCAGCYQGLVCLKGRLGDAMTAHGITNFLLAIWVVGRNAWHFW